MKKTLLLPWALLLFSSADISKMSLFDDRYPKVFAFRGDNAGLNNLAEYTKNSVLDMRKMTDEEVQIDPKQYETIQKFTGQNPDFPYMIHYNGEAIQARHFPKVQQLYFPGHWLYYAGENLSENLAASSTQIKVAKPDRFKENAYLGRNHFRDGTPAPKFLPHDIAIIPKKADGSLDWYNVEYVSLETNRNSVLTVKRGMYGSKARDFKKGDYMAAMVGGFWGGDLQWQFNLSTACPRDRSGRNATDIFLDETLKLLDRDKGRLKHVAGIGWDVHYWWCRYKGADCNVDGEADEGWIEGKNTWLESVMNYDFVIREKMGKHFILTGDSWNSAKQRGVDLYNGMESEGFCRPNDAFRGFSSTMNQMNYWYRFTEKYPKFNYVVLKFNNIWAPDNENSYRYQRMALAYATAWNSATTRPSLSFSGEPYYLPEFFGGVMERQQWLGRPLGEAQYGYPAAADMLSGQGVEMSQDFVKNIETEQCNVAVKGKSLVTTSTFKGDRASQVVKITHLPIPKGDMMITFEVKALGTLDVFPAGSAFPRYLSVHNDAVPLYDDAKQNQEMYNDLGGYFGTRDFMPVTFYFRSMEKSDKKTMTITLSLEGAAPVELRNIRLIEAAPTVGREFEHGILLGNPSFREQVFDLTKLFPGYQGDYYMIRAKAIPEPRNKSANSMAGYELATKMADGRNGSKIEDKTKVAVEPLDGLFLLKQ